MLCMYSRRRGKLITGCCITEKPIISSFKAGFVREHGCILIKLNEIESQVIVGFVLRILFFNYRVPSKNFVFKLQTMKFINLPVN